MMRLTVGLIAVLFVVFFSGVSAQLCQCNSHIGTQFCFSEAQVGSCSSCNSSSCSGSARNCFTGPNINGAASGSSCSSAASYDIQNITYSIVPNGLGENCDPSQCCCLTGSFSVSRTPAGSLTMYFSGQIAGKCGDFQMPLTLPLKSGGQTYAIASDFLGMGPTSIDTSNTFIAIDPVNNRKCYTVAKAAGSNVGMIIGIVAGVVIAVGVVGAIVVWFLRRRNTGYSQV